MTARNDEALTRLRDIATTQHGIVTRPQARACGLSSRQIQWLVARGWLIPLGRHVLLLAGSGETKERAALAGVLGTSLRAVLSHHSAAAFWGWGAFELLPIHALGRYGSTLSHRDGVVVHQTRRLPAHHVVEVEGLWVTTPARTIFDLSGVLHPLWRVEDVLDDAWAARAVTYGSMRQVIDEMSGRGQRNVAQLRAIVEERGPDHIPGDSALERRFHRIISDAGLPPLERQVDMVDDEGWWGRVDGLYRDAHVIAEVDGDRWHSALSHRRRDDERRRRWETMGFEVVRFREHDVWHRPDDVVSRLADARERGLRRTSRRAA